MLKLAAEVLESYSDKNIGESAVVIGDYAVKMTGEGLEFVKSGKVIFSLDKNNTKKLKSFLNRPR